jgi:formate/nitrite transporter FocA (FNT family)
MTLFERLRYSLYLAAVGGAVIGLLISIASADVVGWLPPSAGNLLFSPVFPFALYLVAYLEGLNLLSRRAPNVKPGHSGY